MSYASIRDIERALPEDNPTINMLDKVFGGLGIDLHVSASADNAPLEPEPVIEAFYRALPELDATERRRLARYFDALVRDVIAERELKVKKAG